MYYTNILYYMKLKKEYLDVTICFMGHNHVVRFIDERLHTKMFNSGFDYMFDVEKNTSENKKVNKKF